ncbi:hypothetical protein [Thermococcus sp.]|nr:hypothetical protein [Thermococcus sp.]
MNFILYAISVAVLIAVLYAMEKRKELSEFTNRILKLVFKLD